MAELCFNNLSIERGSSDSLCVCTWRMVFSSLSPGLGQGQLPGPFVTQVLYSTLAKASPSNAADSRRPPVLEARCKGAFASLLEVPWDLVPCPDEWTWVPSHCPTTASFPFLVRQGSSPHCCQSSQFPPSTNHSSYDTRAKLTWPLSLWPHLHQVHVLHPLCPAALTALLLLRPCGDTALTHCAGNPLSPYSLWLPLSPSPGVGSKPQGGLTWPPNPQSAHPPLPLHTHTCHSLS